MYEIVKQLTYLIYEEGQSPKQEELYLTTLIR